ncbi:type II toxin-antitoxin system Phd/YefM family antitoxin [Inquilinus sp. Marseille-Q2685]|uniref:type II toxin-antitoxin system Phd/YefM family antitoxin n=1 Tax=Inquilinus sp. Marseille-Q2685 TaxID=2866581 RepID=UPI001CE41307|nr:type II toxin-antitoxin system prevent-host-death family antitoxin [Inquilinus sp. Marseille-Q2685]
MKQINIYEAKTQLSQIVDRASKGESFVIAKSGTPLAKLVPLDDGRPAKIRFGLMKGEIHIEPDFDASLPDAVLDAFEGGSST